MNYRTLKRQFTKYPMRLCTTPPRTTLRAPTAVPARYRRKASLTPVCQHYGLDTSDYSFGYVAGWSSGKELSELKGSLETIRSTAAKLIETIDGHFAEIQQEKAAVQEQEQEAQPITPELQPAQEQPEQATPQEAAPREAEPPAVKYYPINEAAARRAKEMNSYSDYKPGSATAEYRSYVEEAVQLAERQKARVDPMYHEKIDSLLDTYARKLAANMNKGLRSTPAFPLF